MMPNGKSLSQGVIGLRELCLEVDMKQPKTLAKFQDILIEGYHDAAEKDELIYNRETSELAIKSAAHATFKVLAAMKPTAMVTCVKQIAASAPD